MRRRSRFSWIAFWPKFSMCHGSRCIWRAIWRAPYTSRKMARKWLKFSFFLFEFEHFWNIGTTGNLFDPKKEIHERGVFLRGRKRERPVFLRVQTKQRTHLRPVQVHWRERRKHLLQLFQVWDWFIHRLKPSFLSRFIEKYDLFNVCRHTSNFILKSLFIIHEKTKQLPEPLNFLDVFLNS